MFKSCGLAAVVMSFAVSFSSAQQIQPGAGNAAAVALAQKSPEVQSAYTFLLTQAGQLKNAKLRNQTLDALANPHTCITHRARVDANKKNDILQQLTTAGLINPADGAAFPGGALAGVFPPVLDEGSKCPHLPQAFFSAPGSVFGGHHSYPGGLPVHESNNDISDQNLAEQYRSVYGNSFAGFPIVSRDPIGNTPGFVIDQDIIVGAPLWHDWAKSIVFQWNADGSEFPELNFGGNGSTDNFGGTAGDSRTGGHHIMSIAETMKRGFAPAFVIAQASAHSAPTSGNEYKVVNWLRAAAILAQIDPVQAGYLTTDKQGNFRLPALRKLGDVDLPGATPTQVNLLTEYTLHNLSDADFTYSGPAVTEVEIALRQLAPQFGYDPTDVSRYNNSFRNPVFSFLTVERLQIILGNAGLNGVKSQLNKLHALHVI
ncbi:MAG TPA: hypothetical protein VLK33_09810 [Terriglobales bacterium]|nr:hypothetical protein [Terriglobales bacterium]